MFGGTKKAEYRRTIEMLREMIANKKDVYFILAFLYDSGYQGKDLKEMMGLCKPNTNAHPSREDK